MRKSFIRKGAAVVVAALMVLSVGSASAQTQEVTAIATPTDTAFWRCWYNAPEHVSCIQPPGSRQRFLHIPLHNIPFEMEGVKTLARAVVCGRRPDCAVQFSAELPSAEELDRAMDPLFATLD